MTVGISNYEIYLDDTLSYLKRYIVDMKSRPILFVGSGFSRRYIGSPSWIGLLEQLINENPNISLPIEYFIQEHEGDNAAIASELVEYYRNYAWENRENESLFPPELFTSRSKSIFLKHKISTILKDLTDKFDLDVNEWREEIKLIRRLNPQALITTNYDTLLEKLFPKYEAIVGQKVIREKKATDIGHILKIHGSVEDLSGIVIEKQDYKNFFEKQIYLIAKLFTYFMEHPVIFIGYGLNDDNIKSILYNVKQILDAETEPIIPNMWFIDWSENPINNESTPPQEKSISVGNGESVRVNYIRLHTYEKLYETLYQDSVDIEKLKQIEETVYNVVKSDTITNLEVDIASLRHLTDRENFLNSFTTSTEGGHEGVRSFVTFADITDPNQLASQFCLTATELCKRVYDNDRSYWSYAYELINKVDAQVGINLRESNNAYHVRLEGVSRYSLEMVSLLKKVKDREPYTITIQGEEVSYPPIE
ncbi:SIR2 family protein [Halobacillus sp. Marseille-Q1614]|uniref:SIR2 family protein n=1 Tax=Halobacillus sp. Marseille-Q1614 TaxID=2709134 RepID=UPI0020C1D5AA|nr:SIR2 family protein [Halobacillus sp. Marseille-Q1614]